MEYLGLEKASAAEAIIFAILALGAIVGALLTMTRRNPVGAVMSLVGTFFALAGIYATLSAHFLAVLQVLVYAGAIMVLFIFVVMILNREEVEPLSLKGIFTRGLGVVAIGFGILLCVRTVHLTRGLPIMSGPPGEMPPDYGTVASAGMSLFRDFVYPFEAISLLLLVAIVGGVMVSRSHKQEELAELEVERLRHIRETAGPERRLGPAGAVEADHAAAGGHH